MRLLNQLLNISIIFLVASAQLIVPQIVLDQTAEGSQRIMTQPAVPEDFTSPPMLSDQLSLEPQASIFFSYARESAKLSGILSGVGEYSGQKYTVFVPTNKAVMTLARKPHQSVEDGTIEITDEEAERQSQVNVERWLSAHFIPGTIGLDKGAEGEHQTLLDGKPLSLSRLPSHHTPEWANWRVNSESHIIAKREAPNGIIYLMEGVIEV
ncbi:hypothetical protein FRC18_009483 [Serendipita sp. 400]|nr:hypothetical protein FRC18_009483 [Serendipita sp. 400]